MQDKIKQWKWKSELFESGKAIGDENNPGESKWALENFCFEQPAGEKDCTYESILDAILNDSTQFDVTSRFSENVDFVVNEENKVTSYFDYMEQCQGNIPQQNIKVEDDTMCPPLVNVYNHKETIPNVYIEQGIQANHDDFSEDLGFKEMMTFVDEINYDKNLKEYPKDLMSSGKKGLFEKFHELNDMASYAKDNLSEFVAAQAQEEEITISENNANNKPPSFQYTEESDELSEIAPHSDGIPDSSCSQIYKDKKMNRKFLNNKASRVHRAKKKKKYEKLIDRETELEKKNDELRIQVESMEKELNFLKELLLVKVAATPNTN